MLSGLKKRWNASTGKVILILLVFTCTGFTVLFLKEPVLSLIVEKENRSIWFTVVYYLLILPVYNIILLCYGFVFGQFSFFLEFEKKMLNRMFKNKKANP
ncbi:MAG TPA: prolipoprotein diacylglyceryl transferase [Fulvivirga sp.]|nr:prolipoprotein diacylglyceryl transferase [Fulvivirga sp.]